MNLILGTANFGNSYGKRLERDECFEILDEASRIGVWGIDTASSYGESEKIIQEWLSTKNMKAQKEFIIFSKYPTSTFSNQAHVMMLHDEKQIMKGASWAGCSFYTPELLKIYKRNLQWYQCPFGPYNLDFLEWAHEPGFIARSIFLGGKKYAGVDKETVAELTFRFLNSHKVKNVVFGVESAEELRMNVRIAGNMNKIDTRFL